MKNKHLAVAMILCGATFFSCSKKQAAPYVYVPQAPVDLNWSFETTPVWSDEFSTDGAPDPNKWTYDLGGGGWGNSELETYTNAPANVNVAGGYLNITAMKQNGTYTSARLVSTGA